MQIAVPPSVETLIVDPRADQACLPDPVQGMRALAAGKSVEQVEAAMLALPQADAPVVHRFGPGIYIREVTIPAGVLAIGHAQRFEHMNVMLKGRVTMFNDNDNGTTTELVAPLVFVGKPGRKIGYVHENMVWQNIYATTETDIEKLEATYFEKSDTWQQDQKLRNSVSALQHEVDRADYRAMLAEVGIPHELARAQSENTDDQMPMPMGSYSILAADSQIEGKGLFATSTIAADSVIAPARISGKRTPAGRYTNHSATPNAVMVQRHNGDIDLVATRQIAGCTGGQPGEEITIDYRQALRLSGIRSLK
jgi:hypothetical protein